jgi:hypothetical protein
VLVRSAACRRRLARNTLDDRLFGDNHRDAKVSRIPSLPEDPGEGDELMAADNVELLRYFEADLLDQFWHIGQQIEVFRSDKSGYAVDIRSTGDLADQLFMQHKTTFSQASVAMAYRSGYLMLRDGPVIIRPKLNLCEALLDTEIRIPVADFKMPFPIIGVELPMSISCLAVPVLLVLWKAATDRLFIWTRIAATNLTYHIILGTNKDTVEEWLQESPDSYDADELRMMNIGGRIACNLVMLAATRATRVSELSQRTIRHRRCNDDRLRRLAGRECREIVFRDLHIRERPGHKGEIIPGGYTQEAQHRRGHWKMQPYGPKSSLRKYIWLNDYYTHKSDDKPLPDQTVVLR